MDEIGITSKASIVADAPLSDDPGTESFASAGNALTFDPDEFISHIADLELTEEQATELLGAIWSIMVAFVDLGFGIHPVQQAQSARNGDVGKNLAALDHESALVVSCRGNFNAVLQDKVGPRRKSRRPARTDS